MAWYVKFDDIKGNSKAKDHIHWINAVSVQMGSQRYSGGGVGVGRVGGKMHLEDVSIGILNDIGTPLLLKAAVTGKYFKKVEIHGTATYGDAGEQVYLALELENVQITSYQMGVLDRDDKTDDISVTLNFEKYKTVFTEYSKDGKKGGNVEFEWKIEKGDS